MRKKLLIVSSVLAFSTSILAQQVFQDLVIKGTDRLDKTMVINDMGLKKGAPITDENVDAITKNLFSTGLFSDIKTKLENGVLTITVFENAIVRDTFFEGNKKLDDKALLKEVDLKPRSVWTKAKMQKDVQRLQKVYQQNGQYAAKITPEIIRHENGTVDVIFKIDEGKKTVIEKITFVGNKHFTRSELKDGLISKEHAWWKLFNSTDTYDPDRLNYDKEVLRRFYLQRGYADVRVKSATAELMPDKEGFILTFDVQEGEKYKFDTPVVQGNLPGYKPTESFKKFMAFDKGDVFNTDLIEKTISNMTDDLSDKGYAFVDIQPEFKKNSTDKTIKVIFNIAEGEKIFVNNINIKGNARTLDKVIRREFRIKEGDVFNASKLRVSKQRIEDLGYFEKVDMKPVAVPGQAGKTDIDLTVAEKPTGTFNVGVGWSSYDGMLFEVGVQERNILGTGNIVRLNAMLAQKEKQFLAGFTNPYFMDRNLLAGFDLFHTTRDYEDSSSYKAVTTGGVIRFGWNYTDNLQQIVRYTLKRDQVKDIHSDSVYINDQKGTYYTSMIGQELIYDKRDSKLDPTRGYYLSFGTDYAGIGGDTDFIRVNATAVQYFPVAEDVVFSLRADGGRIWGIGQDVRISNRYFLGEASLRGFKYGGVSARDKASGDALGGNWFATTTAELVFPLGLPKEVGVKGKVFTDAGYIGKPDGYDAETMDYSSKARVGAGFGIVWNSPLGLVNVDWSRALVKEKFDKRKVFRLNFGKEF